MAKVLENKMLDKKYLIIGSSGHQYVECVEWEAAELPNIVDYDIVIINVRSIKDSFLKNVTPERINNLRTLLTRLLISNGSIIILSDIKRVVKRPKKYPDFYNNYSWCPIDIATKSESGTTIDIIEEPFPKYFNKFKKWDYYFFIPKGCLTKQFTALIGDTYNTRYELPQKFFLKNRYGKMLSGMHSIEVYNEKKKTPAYSSSYEYYSETPDNVFGQIVLIPLINELDDKAALNLLLEDIFGKVQRSLAPAWIDDIIMPFIDQFDTKIRSFSDTILELNKQKQIVETKKKEIESYKKLLYEDGNELENIFRKCLNELGAIVDPAKYSEEEYCLVYNDNEYPVEAKGISKSISLTHLRQLIDYMLKYDEETGLKSKGILLGNAWKNLPLEKRNTSEKPNFPSNVVSRAKDMNIALISSVDFFKAFCSFLEDNTIGDSILSKIVNTNGPVDLSEFIHEN